MRTIIGTDEKGENIYHPVDFFLNTKQTTQTIIKELQPQVLSVVLESKTESEQNKEELKRLICLTGDTEYYEELFEDDDLQVNFPLFFNHVDKIYVPKKLQVNLEKYTPKELLRNVDPNFEVAVEKCLLVASNLSSTYFFEDKWKQLHSSILHEQTRIGPNDNTYVYKAILNVLKEGTKKTGAVIEVSKNKAGVEYYKWKEECKSYKLTDCYLKAGLTTYTLKKDYIIQQRNKLFYKQFKEAIENLICKNLIDIYPNIELPTIGEILEEAKRLVKSGHKTKKNKILTFLNKHKKERFKNYKERSFVEYDIELYYFLTKRGFMIPIVGKENNGGRVTDSFTLMPSWIRNLVKINGVALSECDFSAFHPNICANLFGGNYEFLTHKQVSKESGIDIAEVKKENLSFFNKRWTQMYDSPLFNYYYSKEPNMMQYLFYDKKENGHKNTFSMMASKEVEIMTDIIKELNSVGIYVLYVYDALLCQIQDRPIVLETMNRIVLEHGVKTTAK